MFAKCRPKISLKFQGNKKSKKNQNRKSFPIPRERHQLRILQRVSKLRISSIFTISIILSNCLFTLSQDEHMPITDRHHIPALHTRWRFPRIRTYYFTWSAIFLLSSFLFILLLLSLFSCYVPFPRLNKINLSVFTYRGTRWRIWLAHCATNRKVAG
jgi:hypothetical protein